MYEQTNRQKTQEHQRKAKSEQMRRELAAISKHLWTQNRVYEGYWANPHFYQYAQKNQGDSTTDLNMYYYRTRMSKQSKYSLTPFLNIEARAIDLPSN